jgi:hypothetical protein
MSRTARRAAAHKARKAAEKALRLHNKPINKPPPRPLKSNFLNPARLCPRSPKSHPFVSPLIARTLSNPAVPRQKQAKPSPPKTASSTDSPAITDALPSYPPKTPPPSPNFSATTSPSTNPPPKPKPTLYIRYESRYTRAHASALKDLLRLRADKRKSEIGFEAQKRADEKHQMKKDAHYWDVLKKDAQACHELARNPIQKMDAVAQNPDFSAQLEAELAKYNIQKAVFDAAIAA